MQTFWELGRSKAPHISPPASSQWDHRESFGEHRPDVGTSACIPSRLPRIFLKFCFCWHHSCVLQSCRGLLIPFELFMPALKPWFSCSVHGKMTARLPPPCNEGADQCGEDHLGTQSSTLSCCVILKNFLSLALSLLICKMGRK